MQGPNKVTPRQKHEQNYVHNFVHAFAVYKRATLLDKGLFYQNELEQTCS